MGVELHLVRRVAVIAFLAVTLALGTPLRARPWLVTAPLAIPVLVIYWSGFAALFTPTGGVSWAGLRYPAQGLAGLFQRPYVTTVAVLAMLTLAVALARARRDAFDPVVAGLADVALAVSSISAVILLSDVAPSSYESRVFLTSLPLAAQPIAIAIAVLARAAGLSGVALFTTRRTSWRRSSTSPIATRARRR